MSQGDQPSKPVSNEEAAERAMLEKIAKHLLERTRSKSITWQPTERDDMVTHAFGSNSILLSSEDEDEAPPYLMQVANRQGRIVSTLRTENKRASERAEVDKVLRELYPLAVKNSLRVEETLTDVLKNINSDDPWA